MSNILDKPMESVFGYIMVLLAHSVHIGTRRCETTTRGEKVHCRCTFWERRWRGYFHCQHVSCRGLHLVFEVSLEV
ncbi:hypothetical protein L210DRAFT_162910 [Boletus edulis BED1]|uniref:Uncharacterized protein n=1 Tax=Boletus edulis BED1 TaxID=1328754 RepID=A0AAD4BV60_BOLED|nr:hypothetical protein L210DRAFT_162910 [Boletus edulis BED1]